MCPGKDARKVDVYAVNGSAVTKLVRHLSNEERAGGERPDPVGVRTVEKRRATGQHHAQLLVDFSQFRHIRYGRQEPNRSLAYVQGDDLVRLYQWGFATQVASATRRSPGIRPGANETPADAWW